MKSALNTFWFCLVCVLTITTICTSADNESTTTSTTQVTKSHGSLKLKTDGPFKPENFGLNDPITKSLFGIINGAINLVLDGSAQLITPFIDKGSKFVHNIKKNVAKLANLITHVPMSVEDLAIDLDDVKEILANIEDSFQTLQELGLPLSLVPALETVRFNIDAAVPAINIVASGLHLVAQG